MNLKQSLHSLLADNETAEVITQLRAATEEASPKLFEEVEQVAARLEANIEQSHGEFADELSTNKENARIRYLLLSIINRLPEDAELPSMVREKRLKMAFFIITAVAILALAAFNFDLLKKEEPTANPVVERPKVAIAPVVEQPQTVVTPAVAPVVAPLGTPIVTPPVVLDSVKKVDTLVKKKIRRIRKAPVVTEPVLGVSQ
jgi:hypothetical protein